MAGGSTISVAAVCTIGTGGSTAINQPGFINKSAVDIVNNIWIPCRDVEMLERDSTKSFQHMRPWDHNGTMGPDSAPGSFGKIQWISDLKSYPPKLYHEIVKLSADFWDSSERIWLCLSVVCRCQKKWWYPEMIHVLSDNSWSTTNQIYIIS